MKSKVGLYGFLVLTVTLFLASYPAISQQPKPIGISVESQLKLSIDILDLNGISSHMQEQGCFTDNQKLQIAQMKFSGDEQQALKDAGFDPKKETLRYVPTKTDGTPTAPEDRFVPVPIPQQPQQIAVPEKKKQ